MNKAETFAFGVAVGAGLMYVLDPDRGNRRRALLRDQVVHGGHELEDAARSGARHVRNRATGLAYEARSRATRDDADDYVLTERVRSEMGRSVTRPGDIEVEVQQGRVTLSGTVPPREVQDLVRTVRSVRGVEHVDNRLEVREPEPQR